MKTFAANLTAHYALGTTTLAYGFRVTRTDGTVFGWTSHDIADTVDGVIYSASPGVNVSNLVTSSAMVVGNLEFTALHDGTVFTTRDMLSGVWRNAAFVLFVYNFRDLTGGVDVKLAGTLGILGANLNTVSVELRSFMQYLQQSVGSGTSRDCRYRLGSTSKFAGGLCRKDISAAPWRMPFTVTSVTSNQIFRDSARAEAEDFFGAGEVIWLTGLNAGLTWVVSDYAANGTFTLARAMYATVQVGDTGTAIVGCRKRWELDCKTKFNNLLNFGAEKDKRGLGALMRGAAADV